MRHHRGIPAQLVREPRQPMELRLRAPSERPPPLEPEEPAEQRTERRRTHEVERFRGPRVSRSAAQAAAPAGHSIMRPAGRDRCKVRPQTGAAPSQRQEPCSTVKVANVLS